MRPLGLCGADGVRWAVCRENQQIRHADSAQGTPGGASAQPHRAKQHQTARYALRTDLQQCLDNWARANWGRSDGTAP